MLKLHVFVVMFTSDWAALQHISILWQPLTLFWATLKKSKYLSPRWPLKCKHYFFYIKLNYLLFYKMEQLDRLKQSRTAWLVFSFMAPNKRNKWKSLTYQSHPVLSKCSGWLIDRSVQSRKYHTAIGLV